VPDTAPYDIIFISVLWFVIMSGAIFQYLKGKTMAKYKHVRVKTYECKLRTDKQWTPIESIDPAGAAETFVEEHVAPPARVFVAVRGVGLFSVRPVVEYEAEQVNDQ